MAVIGIDLGGTKISGAVFSDNGEMTARHELMLERRSGREVGGLIENLITQLVDASSARVSAAGVCVPGIYFAASGNVWAPNIPGWDDYPLLSELEQSFGSRMDIRVDSDRACYILGETWQGSAKGCRDAVFLAIGTGIGAGILVDGRILRGRGDVAGAVGWMALDRPFREEYASCGCFEYHASGNGLAKVARDYLETEPGYAGRLRDLDPAELTARHVFSAYEAGDRVAEHVFRNAISMWGMAVANLVSVFNPEKIIFGGGVFGPATRFLDDIYAEALKWAQPVSIRQVTLEATTLGPDAGLYGAGRLTLGVSDLDDPATAE